MTPTGNAAYLVQGSTAHSFLGVPTGGRSCNELTVPSGPLLEKIEKKCENLKFWLVMNDQCLDAKQWAGWNSMHVIQSTKEPMEMSYGEGFLWQCLWEMMFRFLLCVPPPVYISDCGSAPCNHGCLVWTMFDSAVELTQIIQ